MKYDSVMAIFPTIGLSRPFKAKYAMTRKNAPKRTMISKAKESLRGANAKRRVHRMAKAPATGMLITKAKMEPHSK